MKGFVYLLGILIMIIITIIGCSDKSQLPVQPITQSQREGGSLGKCIIISYTSSDYPVGILDPGVVKLERGKWIIRNVVVKERFDSDNPLIAGVMIHNLSGILNAITGEGPICGTLTVTPDNAGGGVWEGSYSGWRSKKPGSDTLFTLPLKVIARGKGGTINNMQLFGTTIITAWGTPPVGWYGSSKGFIKSNSKH